MNIDNNSAYAIIITLITVLGSAGAFKFYERKIVLKQKKELFEKDDCKERIEKLELLLSKSSDEKDIMREQILRLTEQVSCLKTKVEFLEKENRDLMISKK